MTITGVILPAVMIVLGAAMIVRAAAGGGGPMAIGVLVGLLFIAAGAGRIYLGRRS